MTDCSIILIIPADNASLESRELSNILIPTELAKEPASTDEALAAVSAGAIPPMYILSAFCGILIMTRLTGKDNIKYKKVVLFSSIRAVDRFYMVW